MQASTVSAVALAWLWLAVAPGAAGGLEVDAFVATGQAHPPSLLVDTALDATVVWDGASDWRVELREPETGLLLHVHEFEGSAHVYEVQILGPCLEHSHAFGESSVAPDVVFGIHIHEILNPCDGTRILDADGTYLGLLLRIHA